MAWDMWLVINLHPHSLEEIQGICPNHKCSMKKFWKFLFLKVFYHRVRVCLISKPLNQVYGDFLNVSVPAKFCNEKWLKLKLVRLIACNSTFKIMDCLSFQNQLTKITYKKLIYSWNLKKNNFPSPIELKFKHWIRRGHLPIIFLKLYPDLLMYSDFDPRSYSRSYSVSFIFFLMT